MKGRGLKKEFEINELKKELILKLVDKLQILLIFHKLILTYPLTEKIDSSVQIILLTKSSSSF